MRKMNFSNELKELMVERKISQQTLANQIGVSQRAVSKWLRGESEPTATNIFNIAVYFSVSADFLLGLSD